jgi:hypothetical protein
MIINKKKKRQSPVVAHILTSDAGLMGHSDILVARQKCSKPILFLRMTLLLLLGILVTSQATAKPTSTKLYDRLLCEVCHAIGNHTTVTFYPVGDYKA